METKIYNQKGKETGSINLPEGVFGLKKNNSLVHQVAVSLEANKRAGTAHTKNRGDVAGGGKKPWQQKGTGRARHGSIRSPLWKGGGVTHGPRSEKDYGKKINKKMRAKALYTVLSAKLRDGEIFFVDSLSLSEPKAKVAKETISNLSKIPGAKNLSTKKNNAIYFAAPSLDKVSARGFQNFGNVLFSDIHNMNVLDTLKYKYLVILNPKESIATLEARMK